MMSFIDGMTAHMFRPDADSGRAIFYPSGTFGRGYVLPDQATELKIRRLLRWMMLSVLATSIIGVQVLVAFYGQPMTWSADMWMIAVLVTTAFTLAVHVMMRRSVAGLQPSEQRLTMAQAFSAQTRGLPRWYFYVMAVFGPLLMVGSILWLANAPSFMERVWAVVGLILFTVSTVQAIAGIRMKPDPQGPAESPRM